MNARPVMFASLAVVLAAGACGTSAAGTDEAEMPAVAAKPSPSAHDLLLRSLPDATHGSVRFATTGDVPTSGVDDPAAHALRIDLSQKQDGFTLTMNFLFVEKQSWVKISLRGAAGLPKLPKKWMLLDPAKLKKGADAIPTGYDDSADPGDTGLLLQSATGVRQTSPGHFAGRTDVSGTADGDVTDAKTLAALGAAARTVPFTATVDGQGRLSSMQVRIPKTAKTRAQTYAVTFRDYGTARTPAKPSPADQQKATATVYDMLNG